MNATFRTAHMQFLIGPAMTVLIGLGLLVLDRMGQTVPAPGGVIALGAMFAAYYGGLVPGLISAAVGFTVTLVLFLNDQAYPGLAPEDLTRLGLFVVFVPGVVFIISRLTVTARRALDFERANRERAEAVAAELQNLRDAFDQIDYGIMLLDRNLCAEFMNRAVCELGKLDIPKPGERPAFADLIRQVARNAAYAAPKAELDALVARRIAWVSSDKPEPTTIHMADGRVMGITCIVMGDGARMLTYTDETETLRHVDELEELASIDSLTGLFNRRHFEMQAETEWDRFKRYKRSMSVLMIDIDLFKSINDLYGHDIGDKVIRAVAEIGSNAKRGADIMARIGGEEFVLLLPETDLTRAIGLAERLREAVAGYRVSTGDRDVAMTVSIGVAEADAGMANLADLMKQADQALYRAKRSGRNRVSFAQGGPNLSVVTAA